jgi:hypothetical protein
MVELFVYDASEVNREGYIISHKSPVLDGLRNALQSLNPPIPFLIRGRQGDYDLLKDNKIKVKNTFWGRSLKEVLKNVLYSGTERSEDFKIEDPRFDLEKKDIKNPSKDLKPQDVIWAIKERYIDLTQPYRYEDDCGGFTEGQINDFSMIFNPDYYATTDKGEILFYQQNIKLRRQALLGIIISDTNPNRPLLEPLQFTLTPKNLEQVISQMQSKGYFQKDKQF